ncbi:MAG: MCE family protein [Bacteroidetes bacterium]|nr:MCE family protein [Bacteroidota bacterium]
MKLSDEFKVGVFASISIVVLIVGFNFLKGKDLLASNDMLYAEYRRLDGLNKANPVFLQGLQIGKVIEITPTYTEQDSLLITIGFTIERDVRIPKGSVALITKPDILGTMALEIIPAKSMTELVSDGDYLIGRNSDDIFDQMEAVLAPLKAESEKLMSSLSQTLQSLEATFDKNAQADIRTSIEDLRQALGSMKHILSKGDNEFGQITATFKEAGNNIKTSTVKLDKSLADINTLTESLRDAPIHSAVVEARGALEKLNSVLAAANDSETPLGMLVKDKELAKKIDDTIESIDALAKDIKAEPRNYLAPLGRRKPK